MKILTRMERVTLSLPSEHLALLDDAADEWGVSRSAAARRVFSAYEDRMNTAYELPGETAESSHDVHTEFTRRLDALAERVAALEEDREPRPPDVRELDDLIEAAPGATPEAAPSESAQPATERDESAADPQPTADASHSDGRRERADVARAVETVAESWGDDPERLAARKAAATAVLTAALEEGPIGRSEAVDRFYAEYSVGGQSERTWWRKNVRPVLTEFGSYSQGQQGYVVDGLPTAEEKS